MVLYCTLCNYKESEKNKRTFDTVTEAIRSLMSNVNLKFLYPDVDVWGRGLELILCL